MDIKIVKLTPMNVEALNLMAPKVTGLVTITKTTATFTGVDARQALGMVSEMQAKAATEYGKTGGPYASLSAVRRKVAALVEAEQAEELAAAQARSDARAEADAASDPLVALLGTDPATGPTYGAAIRPKAWVTAHVVDAPVRERVYRSKPGAGRVSGRLLVKCGRRRNRG